MLDRLNEALEHIEDRLDQQIETADLSRIAMTSEYHFRRLFSALAGMPLSVYIRRRRLTLAGAEVLAGERTLLDIAVRYGYGSGEAFARAFRAQHGVGPAEARRTGAALSSQSRISFRLTVEGSSNMRYRIVEKDEFRLVGKKARVPLIHEGVNPAIAEFVQSIPEEVNERLSGLSDQEPHGIVSVAHNFGERAEGTELDYYYAVLTSGPAPSDLDHLTVPPGTWALFEAVGRFPLALQYLWRDIYTLWFPSNPYEARPGPEICHVDYNDEDGTTAAATIWVPVSPTTT